MIPKSIEPNVSLKSAVQLPHLSLVVPFAPRTTSKDSIGKRLKALCDIAKTELNTNSNHFLNKELLQKLESVFQRLDYTSSCKSVYISLSPFAEEVYYLNVPTKEYVTTNTSFGVHDVAGLKKEEKSYLLLVLQNNSASIYHGCNEQLSLRVVNEQRSGDSKFLQQVANNLDILAKAFSLPLVIVGSTEILSAFRYINKQKPMAELVIDTEINIVALKKTLASFLQVWDKAKQKHLVHQLEETLQKGKLEVGIKDVWLAAKERKPILLVVEEGYSYPSYLSSQNDFIYADAIPMNSSVQVRDAVTDAIEKILINGGNVEIVPKGLLQDFMHIALILA